MGDRGEARAVSGRPVSLVRMAVYSAVISLITFLVGIGALIALSQDRQDATCDLVRAQINALTKRPPSPEVPDQLAAWVRFGERQGCIR